MDRADIQNPFVVGKYLSDKYFCDRSQETDLLRKQIQNGRNVTLISPRRIGKSGLIQHFFNQDDIKEQYYVFFVDIYATTSLAEFVYTLGKEIYAQLKPQATVWKEKFFQIISSFRVGFKLDTLSGMPTFDLGLGDILVPQTTLDEIFAYIEEADKPCIIAIDEFQQINTYAEKNTEALLRTKIQLCRRAQFIFSGSKRHTMSNMFNSPSKPFYRQTIEMVWSQYEGYTWFIQMMMNELYALTPPHATCTTERIAEARHNVIAAQEGSYKDLLSNLPPRQKMILQAIAKERVATNITSAKFVKKYNLHSASSVQSAVKLLLKNDMLTQTDTGFRVYDFFLADWLANVY